MPLEWVPDRTANPVEKYNKWNVRAKGMSSMLDEIAVNKNGKSLAILNADNDNDKTPKDKKVSLADIALGVYINKEKKKGADLEFIRVQTVVNKNTQPALDKVCNAKGSKSFDVNPTADKKSFDELDATQFGKIVARILVKATGGKKVKSIKVEECVNMIFII